MDDELSRAVAEARASCESAAPEEAVGALVHVDSGRWAFHAFQNVSPTPARAFVVDPKAWMTFERRFFGCRIWLVHSHVEAPPTLSAWDRETFTVDGRPLLPQLGLVVMSVRAGRVAETGWYVFSDGAWAAAPAL